MNSVLGGLIATLIAMLTAALALLSGEGITAVTDISGLQWTILVIGGAITFLKDWQSITSRRIINMATGSGDGGGAV